MSDIENENEPEIDDKQIEGVEETKDNISESEEEEEEEEENDRNEDYDEEEPPDDESVQDDEEDEQNEIYEKIEDEKNPNITSTDNGYQGFDGSNDSDSDESDSECEDEYVCKVDIEKKMEYIKETHTQEISKTYEEMIALTKIKRKKNITDGEDMIVDEKHTTVPILTKYEKTRILGIRVSQLNEGAPRFINVGNNQTIIDNNIIAEKELRMKKLPFIVTRPLPSGETEHWRLRDLEIV
tara:strand:- start:26 stop:745 length:720 start_codon:yes stop_codon:yes gene_type:complete